MTASHVSVEKLSDLRTELIDLAYALEVKGRMDAADLALSISAKLGELCGQAPDVETGGRLYFWDVSGGSVA